MGPCLRSRRTLALLAAAGLVAGCGGSSRQSTAASRPPQAPSDAVAPPIAPAVPTLSVVDSAVPEAGASAASSRAKSHSTVPGGSGCPASAVRAFAREKRLAPAERAALDALLVELARHPLRIRCASSSLQVLGSTPAPGKPDYRCLAAATFVMPLLSLPGIPAAVEHAAQRANAAIHAYEQHGDTFCVAPAAPTP